MHSSFDVFLIIFTSSDYMFIFPCYFQFSLSTQICHININILILIISKLHQIPRWLCSNYMNTEIHSHLSYLQTISKSTKQHLSYLIEKYVVLSAAICSYLKKIIIRTYSLDHLLSTFSFIMSLGETLCFSFVIDHNLFNNFKCFHLSVYLFLKPLYAFIHFFFIFYYWYFFFIFILLLYSVLTY